MRPLLPGSHHRFVATTLVVLAAAGLVVAAEPPAAAAASTTAAPAADAAPPRVLFVEDFEHGAGTSPITIDEYVGARGERYTADRAWIDRDQCNGVVMSYRMPSGSCRSDLGAINTFSNALGRINGTDPMTNHSVSAWTRSRDVPANAVQLRSSGTVDLGRSGRFVTFGVDAVAGACSVAHPLLDFALVDGGAEHRVNGSSIDPCSSRGSQSYSVDGFVVRGGHFVSDAAVLMQGDSLGWVMRNRQWAANGNDGAIDAVTAYDATPKLENAFDGSRPFVGETARLTFTVRNTTERGAKPGWSFTEALPDGLVLAQDPAARTDCDAGRVVATGGGSTVAVTGGLRGGSASCEIAVDVTSESDATYTVDGSTVREHRGLDLPDATSVTFLAEENSIAVTDTPVLTGGDDDGFADVGEAIAFRQRVTNTGTRALADLEVSGSNGAVTCAERSLAVGAATTCTTSPRPVRQADVDAGAIGDAVEAVAVSPRGAVVRATAEAEQPATPRNAAIGTTITATIGEQRAAPGDPVGLVVGIVNVGNVTLHDVRGEIDSHEDLPVDCPSDTLAPRERVECAVPDHLLDQADIDAGTVAFTHRAAGLDPSGAAVAAEAEDEVAVPRESSITTEIASHLAESDHRVPLAGDAVRSEITVTNTGSTTLIGPGATIDGRPELAVTCPDGPLAPGDTITCAVADVALDQDAIEDGLIRLDETATATAPDGEPVAARSTITVGLDAASALFLGADHRPSRAGLRIDDTVASDYRVTNTSNLVVVGVEVDGGRAGATSCDDDVLEPGAATSCRAVEPSLVTADDERARSVSFRSEATGLVGRADGPPEETVGTLAVSARDRSVAVRSNEVVAAFPIEQRPAPTVLAFTGASGSAAALIAAGVLLAAGVAVGAARRATGSRGARNAR